MSTSAVERVPKIGPVATSRVGCLRVAAARVPAEPRGERCVDVAANRSPGALAPTSGLAPSASACPVEASLAPLIEERTRESLADGLLVTRPEDCSPDKVFEVEPILPELVDRELVAPAEPGGPPGDDVSDTLSLAPTVSAAASPQPKPAVIPTPMPKATANPPTRPTHLAAFMTAIRTHLTEYRCRFRENFSQLAKNRFTKCMLVYLRCFVPTHLLWLR